MTWPTHTLLGINTLWLFALVPPELLAYDFGTLAAYAAFGALLPDLDASESKIKHLRLLGTRIKPFFILSQIVSRTSSHRGLLHSLAGLGMAATILAPASWWFGWAPTSALLLGYASHLAADAATKSGVRLLYPRLQRYHLLSKPWRFTTGSLAEEMLLPLLVVGVFSLLLRSTPLSSPPLF